MDCILNISKSQCDKGGEWKRSKDSKDEMTGSPREHRMCPEFTDLFPDAMGYLPLIGCRILVSLCLWNVVMLPKRTPRTAQNKKIKNQRKQTVMKICYFCIIYFCYFVLIKVWFCILSFLFHKIQNVNVLYIYIYKKTSVCVCQAFYHFR